MANLDKHPIEKTKDLLGISTDITVSEIYDKLFDYRNSQHPDKYQDPEAKKIAEEKFKEVGNLLDSLKKEIELQLVNKQPSEILLYQKTYDSIQLKQDIVKSQDEIQNLKTKLSSLDYENNSLKKELKTLRDEKLKEKTADLINHYKPTKKGIFSNGIIFILTLSGTILTKIEDISLFILKYSPIPEDIINYILFAILLLVPLKMLYQYLRQQIIERISQLITTPPFIQLFLTHITKDNSKVDSFNENDVFSFISRINYPKNDIFRSILRLLFNTDSFKVINGLKDIFIYNLLNKQLVEISRADKLDRTFKIVKGYNFNFDLDDLDL